MAGDLLGGGGEAPDVSGNINAAIQASKEATDKAIAEYDKVQQQNRADLSPYRMGGNSALNDLFDALGLSRPSDAVGGFQGLANYNYNAQNGQQSANDLNSIYSNVASLFHPTAMAAGNSTATNNGVSGYNIGDGGQFGFISNAMSSDDPLDVKIQSLKDIGKYVDAKLGGLGALGGRREADFQQIKSMLPSDYSKFQNPTTPTGPNPNDQANWGRTDASTVLDRFRNTPGYQFALNQGLGALDKSAASKGLLGSGRAMKAITRYGTGLADQTYQNYVSNLSNAAGMGYQGTALGTAQNQQTGQQVGEANLIHGSNVGNAQLADAQMRLSSWAQQQSSNSSMFGSLGSLAGNLFGGSGGGLGSLGSMFGSASAAAPMSNAAWLAMGL